VIEDMKARKLGATRTGPHSHCNRFAAFLNRSSDAATTEDIRRFQLHLAEAGVSICNRNRIMTGLRFLSRLTLRHLEQLPGEVYHIREPQKLPLVMSLTRRGAAGRRQQPQGSHGRSDGPLNSSLAIFSLFMADLNQFSWSA
jgi:hypothetical protein